MIRTLLLSLLLLALFLPSFSFAGDNPSSVHAVRITVPPPKIDGALDDAVWKVAEPATDFLQRDPEEGKPGSERSEVRILYDDDALYFGCMFHDREPEKIVARLTRRDDEIESDEASIRLDAYHDHQTAYEFTFNAAGVKIDKLQYDDGNKEDDSWDPVWEVQTRITPEGWIAEVKIPFRILRYNTPATDTAENVWGMNLIRYISRKQEAQFWAFTPKSESGVISRYGHLLGLRNLPTPSHADVLPFIVGKQQYLPATDHLHRTEEFVRNAGLDIKYGVSSNFFLDATVNPDFGQVEADPSVLNLSAFETFYPEKRPFFIEGTQILHFTTFGGGSGPGMFYSRRIGRGISPFEADPRGGYIASIPQSTAILGAAKLTGKTKGGLSVGILEAATPEERVLVVDSAGRSAESVIEPLANYNVVRLKQDILGNSNIGMIVTATVKDARLPAFTNGYDWNLKFDRNAYQLDGFFAISHAANSSQERMTGNAGRLTLAKIAALHWLYTFDFDFTSPKYNINDVGFFFSPNDIGYSGTLTYKEDQPGPFLRNYSASGRWHQRWDFSGLNLFRDVTATWNALLLNYWSVNADGQIETGTFDNYETHGNGTYRKPHSYQAEGGITSDGRNAVVVNFGPQFAWDAKRMRQFASKLGLDVKLLSWMGWQVQWTYSRVRNRESWGRFSDISNSNIFGDRSTDEHDFTIRSTTTFTRELTLQVYGQIFLAKGHYANDRQLAGASAFIPVAAGEPALGEFNEQILHTNIVLRWEYLPGSTMYLVWSQARNGTTGYYDTPFRNDFTDTFQSPPSNVLLLKMNYWIRM